MRPGPDAAAAPRARICSTPPHAGEAHGPRCRPRRGRGVTGAPLVRRDVEAGVARLTLDSPHNRNALSTALVTQLVEGLDAALADPAVRVIVLTGAGPVFCSGADLKEQRQYRQRGEAPPV